MLATRRWQLAYVVIAVVLFAAIPSALNATESKPVRVSTRVMMGNIVNKQPVFPPGDANIKGIVKLDALVGASGAVQELHVISGSPMLTVAAIDSVKQWRFHPHLLHGRAVPVRTILIVEFDGRRMPFR